MLSHEFMFRFSPHKSFAKVSSCHNSPLCTPVQKESVDGGWHFQTHFWSPVQGDLISGEGWEDLHPLRVRLPDEGHGCGCSAVSIMLRTIPFFSTAGREAPGLCSAALVDLNFSLPAAAVFR